MNHQSPDTTDTPPNPHIPTCIGIIMDGNRRWARERGLPTLEGHRKGYKKLKDTLEWCKEASIRHLVVYAFSTENWHRSEEEVAYLMDLFRDMVADVDRLRGEGEKGALHFVGDLSRFDQDLQASMLRIHKENDPTATHHLWVAVSYGGRPELLQAVNAILNDGVRDVNEETFSQYLWTNGMPDPDLIIRTGGEQRLSNFLTWQSVYSELFFPKTYWPAFTKEDFQAILEEYATRERRHGK